MSASGSGSVMLQPYRSLGLISSASARPHLKLLGSARFLTVPLGRAWCVYNLDALRVVLMGAARAQPVRAIASQRDLTFTACGSDIIVWRRQEEQCRLRMHTRAVYLLYLFGGMLCSVDEGQTLAVWDVQTLAPAVSVKAQLARATAAANSEAHFIHHDGTRHASDWKAEPVSVIQFPTHTRISCLLHPSTYMNKLVVGFSGAGTGAAAQGGGGLELWNIKTRACIYRFRVGEWSGTKHNPEKKLAEQLGRDGASATAHAGTKRGMESAVDTAAASVTCMEQSPAVDVIAVGLHNGLLVLLNLRLDQVLHVYVHAPPSSLGAGGAVGAAAPSSAVASPISSLSFRTDNHGTQLASACAGSGTVAVWDLEKKQLKTLIKNAHGGATGGGDGLGTSTSGADAGAANASVTIHSMFFLPNEPVLLTCGSDNALRMWIFDALDGSARLLKERSGHALPPTRIRFYGGGERGNMDILSAGADRALRTFSLQKEEQSRELSQGHVASEARTKGVAEASLKLTCATDFVCSSVREKEWSNILSAHASDCAGHLWKWGSKSLSPLKLLNTNPGATASAAKTVALSPCGNFGFLGMHNGRIDQFNVQSATWKATFGSNHHGAEQIGANANRSNNASRNINVKRKEAKEALLAGVAASAAGPSSSLSLASNLGHTLPVTGLAVDGLSRLLISCGLDGLVLFWDMKKRTLLGRVDLKSPCSRMAFSVENDLVAVMDDALVVHVLDSATRTVVRRFNQHRAPLTDMIFSPDAKWLLTASSDCTLRIFDIPSATLVDFMRFDKPVSSLAMSPKGEFVATSHVNNLGVYLWANKNYFGTGGALEGSLGGTNGIVGSSLARTVANNVPVNMEVVERQDGEAEPEGDEAHLVNVKQEESEEEDEEEDSDDEVQVRASAPGSSKRRRGLDNGGSALRHAQTPLLHMPDADQFDLITYSSTPKSLWHTLGFLDVIRARNAPKEAVKAPVAAPFFLTALASLSNEKDGPSAVEQAQQRKLADTFGVSASAPAAASAAASASGASGAASAAAAAAPALGSRTIKSGGIGLASTLVELLQQAQTDLPRLVRETPNQHPRVYLLQAYAPVTAFLQSLSPSSLDAEVSSLGLDPLLELSELQLILSYFLAGLESQKNFEFVQALMNRVLKVHGSTIATHPELLELCARLSDVQHRVWQRLEEAFQGNLALVSHLAQIQL